jgi:hypothetical protein
MAQDAPPDEVLLELGRILWSATTLEGVVYTVCRSIKPQHGLFDDCPISTRIGDPLGDILARAHDDCCPPATAHGRPTGSAARRIRSSGPQELSHSQCSAPMQNLRGGRVGAGRRTPPGPHSPGSSWLVRSR